MLNRINQSNPTPSLAILAVASFLALFVIPVCQAAPPNSELARPNVILILADDMALGDLASLNGGISRTPNLDRLKNESVWFSQAT